MVLIIKHIDIEGPGLILDYVVDSGIGFKTIELSRGEELPERLCDVSAVFIMGGPMNVYEEDKYPFLRKEDNFIKQLLIKNIPVLGICLGAQLLAKSQGALIMRAPFEEIGWYKVRLTDKGAEDPLFFGIEKQIDVFQWHQDTFMLPKGAKLLATSQLCENQAFRIGECAWGLQFHIEMTQDLIIDWAEEYINSQDKELRKKATFMIEDYRRLKVSYKEVAKKIFQNFLSKSKDNIKERIIIS